MRAALQDWRDAKANLGAIYESGRGAPQDLKQALYWYNEAEEQESNEEVRLAIARLERLLDESSDLNADPESNRDRTETRDKPIPGSRAAKAIFGFLGEVTVTILEIALDTAVQTLADYGTIAATAAMTGQSTNDVARLYYGNSSYSQRASTNYAENRQEKRQPLYKSARKKFVFPTGPGTEPPSCSCRCVEGEAVSVCNSPAAYPTKCYNRCTSPVSASARAPTSMPPIPGTTQCADRRVTGSQGGLYETRTLCW